MATLRKYRGKWSVAIRRKGHRAIYESFEQKSDARSFINKTESEIQQNKFKDISEAANTTLRTVLHRYIREKLKTKTDKGRERSKFNVILRDEICKYMLAELKSSDFAKYRDARLKLGITNSTINRELSCMRVAIQTSIDEWDCWIPENPVKSYVKLTENPARERRLEAGEYDKLMSACKRDSKFASPSIYWCPAINFAIETAMRLSEQLTLNWKHVDLIKRTAYLPAELTKTKHSRTVPLTDKAIEVLKEIPRHIHGRVFPMSLNYHNRGWRALCKRAGVEGLRWHDLRREATSKLFERGLSISEVQSVTGHRTLQMLSRYTTHDAAILAEKIKDQS
jgi:integrase|tara:strand:+ start:89 stop:1102 length:1014 start_codon:yes stop_codon:yes gene_type:complete